LEGGEKQKMMHKITFVLLIVGGLNWLFQGVFNWEIGALFGGQDALISRIIYILVGLSAIWQLVTMSGSKKPQVSPTQPQP